MPIETILTVGWPPITADNAYNAVNIHTKATQAENYLLALRQILTPLREQAGTGKPLHIKSTDRLFRRRTEDFSAIKKFVRASETIIDASLQPIFYEMDVFSYAFLKGAKNLDAILRETSKVMNPFREILPQWQAEIKSLEDFEREGIMPKTSTVADKYLELRRIIAPGSARDERRTLATLLISGPSTAEEIAKDLGMSYGLSERMLPLFEQINIVQGRDEQGTYRYVLTTEALPRVLFCVRETVGIDFVEIL